MNDEETPERGGHPKGPIFIPKTFGFGYTLNFARWESFVIVAVVIALLIGNFLYRKH